MSDALQQNRSLEVIGAEIRALTASMLGNVIEIGRRMVEAKELLPHGEFGSWIKANTGYSHSTANNFMRLYNEFGNPQQSLFGAEVENSQTFGKLSYTKALALLALPSAEEREEFVETHDVAAMSTRELEQAIRERDEAKAEAEKAREEVQRAKEYEKDLLSTIGDANEKADKLARELEALKSRPVELAVQEPDPEKIREQAELIAEKAIAEQAEKAAAEIAAAKKNAKAEAKAAEKAAAEEKKALEDKLGVMQAKLNELMKKQAEIADAKTSAIYQDEINRLQKLLAMSGAEVTAARLHFSAWQDAYRKLMEAVETAPKEAADKLRAAIKAQAEAWAK